MAASNRRGEAKRSGLAQLLPRFLFAVALTGQVRAQPNLEPVWTYPAMVPIISNVAPHNSGRVLIYGETPDATWWERRTYWFDPSAGEFIPADAEEFTWGTDVAVDASGNVFVAHFDCCVRTYDEELVHSFDFAHDTYPRALATNSLRQVVVLTGFEEPDELNVYSEDGERISSFNVQLPTTWADMTIDAQDQIIVFDDNGRVLVFDRSGELLRDVVLPVGERVQVTANSRDEIVAIDLPGERLRVFHPSGRLLLDTAFTAMGSIVGLDAQDHILVGELVSTPRVQFPTRYGRLRRLSPTGDATTLDIGGVLQASSVGAGESGRIVVAETQVWNDLEGQLRIHVLDSGGRLLTTFGGAGTEEGLFQEPAGLAVGSEDNIAVADSGNHRVQVFDPEGSFLFALGRSGSGSGEFDRPWDVLFSGTDLAVVDRGNHRVQVFDRTGDHLFTFGANVEGLGNLVDPISIAFDTIERYVVLDLGDSHVKVYTRSGEFLFAFETDPIDGGGVATDAAGRILVTATAGWIRVFTSTGILQYATKLPRAWWAYDIAVDPEDRIIVVDGLHVRVGAFPSEVSGIVPGDCNADGNLDLSDGICLMHQLFGDSRRQPPLPCEGWLANLRLLDSNGDEFLDISDPIAVFNHLFAGGPFPILGAACQPIAGCPSVCSR